jgi:hypothetical protein
VIVPLVIVTVWPVVILVLFKIISALPVPTVRPVILDAPALFWITAIAAVPVPVATALRALGDVANVRTAPDTVPHVVLKLIVTNVAAPAVWMTSLPAT